MRLLNYFRQWSAKWCHLRTLQKAHSVSSLKWFYGFLLSLQSLFLYTGEYMKWLIQNLAIVFKSLINKFISIAVPSRRILSSSGYSYLPLHFRKFHVPFVCMVLYRLYFFIMCELLQILGENVEFISPSPDGAKI